MSLIINRPSSKLRNVRSSYVLNKKSTIQQDQPQEYSIRQEKDQDIWYEPYGQNQEKKSIQELRLQLQAERQQKRQPLERDVYYKYTRAQVPFQEHEQNIQSDDFTSIAPEKEQNIDNDYQTYQLEQQQNDETIKEELFVARMKKDKEQYIQQDYGLQKQVDILPNRQNYPVINYAPKQTFYIEQEPEQDIQSDYFTSTAPRQEQNIIYDSYTNYKSKTNYPTKQSYQQSYGRSANYTSSYAPAAYTDRYNYRYKYAKRGRWKKTKSGKWKYIQ